MAKRETKRKAEKRQKKTVINPIKNADTECPVWIFDKIDRAGKFAFDTNRSEFQHKEVLDKIIDYSTMTWAEIKRQTHDNGKSKHHIISPEQLSKEARERLKAKQLDEFSDAMFSFALQNKLRIIGIRMGAQFLAIWYDPQHEFCPSKLKHT